MTNNGCGNMNSGEHLKTLKQMGASGESNGFSKNMEIGMDLALASFTPSDDIYYHPKCLGGKTLIYSGGQTCKGNDGNPKKYHDYNNCIGDNKGGLLGYTGDVISNLNDSAKKLLDIESSENDSCKLVYVETTNYNGTNKNRCCQGVYLKQKQIDSLDECDYFDPSQKTKFDSCTTNDNYCKTFVDNESIENCKVDENDSCDGNISCCEGFTNNNLFSNIENTTNYSRKVYLFSCGFILLYLFGQCMK